MTRDLRTFCCFQLNFRFCFPLLIFQVQMISAQQIEQFCRLENYKLLVSAEKQLADPLFSSYSVHMQFMSKVAAVIVGLSPCCFHKGGFHKLLQPNSNPYSQLLIEVAVAVRTSKVKSRGPILRVMSSKNSLDLC